MTSLYSLRGDWGMTRARECTACEGTGQFDKLPCPVCYGTGWMWAQTGYEGEREGGES